MPTGCPLGPRGRMSFGTCAHYCTWRLTDVHAHYCTWRLTDVHEPTLCTCVCAPGQGVEALCTAAERRRLGGLEVGKCVAIQQGLKDGAPIQVHKNCKKQFADPANPCLGCR